MTLYSKQMKLPLVLEEPEQRRPKKKKRTTAGRPKGTTRRQWPKEQEKALRKEFRKEMMEGRLPGQDVCLEAMKRYHHAQKWQDIKDKVRNMQVSDARKWKLEAIPKTFTSKLFHFHINLFSFYIWWTLNWFNCFEFEFFDSLFNKFEKCSSDFVELLLLLIQFSFLNSPFVEVTPALKASTV